MCSFALSLLHPWPQTTTDMLSCHYRLVLLAYNFIKWEAYSVYSSVSGFFYSAYFEICIQSFLLSVAKHCSTICTNMFIWSSIDGLWFGDYFQFSAIIHKAAMKLSVLEGEQDEGE
jgi:hypothetical protein